MTRSWWGWGDESAAVTGDELDGLAQVVAARFGGSPPVPITPPDVADVPVAAPRVALPAGLAHLASPDTDPHPAPARPWPGVP